jgi:hypothetical protein
MTDVSIVRAVAYGLVGALLATIVAIAVLAGLSHPVPSILQEIAIGALGATAGLLAKTSTEPVPTTTVTYGTPAISYVPAPVPTSSTTVSQPVTPEPPPTA